ncbi:MAG TPA: DsbA family protein [Acetobacteraceae bacterium]|nr:DsbA family protein [Acetobacteraceae bacterium]
MTVPAPLEFWFDFGSPYAWLAAQGVEGVAARAGCKTSWRPFLLGVVFRETGMAPLAEQRFRGEYGARDVARLARRMGLRFATAAVPAGVSVACSRTFYALPAADAPRFARAALDAGFAAGRDLGSAEAARGLAASLGMDALGADGPEARAALRAATAEAIARGIFGSPFFVADGEPFWGQDRLAMVEDWLTRGPW